jgi:hypothetical protein
MDNKHYPLFVPPSEVAEKSHRQWSKKEARIYFDWLMRVAPDRIRELIDFLGFAGREPDRRLLSDLGKEVALLLVTDDFSWASGGSSRTLSDRGHALAADMGLLTAQVLLEKSAPAVRWMILEKPRSDMSFNLPVLSGFGDLVLDPIGGSIAESTGVLMGRRDSRVWLGIFDYWSSRVG